MGLLDTLKQVKADGFDPKKDKISKNARLEAGTYPVRLKSAQADVNNAGQDQLAISLEVVSGKEKGRLEIIYLSFDEGLPEFVLDKNGRILLKVAALSGAKLTPKESEDVYTASVALERGIGSQFSMNLSISPNKKNPNYPYRNYEFAPLEEPKNDLDFDEENLPF